MQYTSYYITPLGRLLLAADDQGLTGLWFEGEKYFAGTLDPDHRFGDCPAFARTREWLDLYFSGSDPGFLPPLHRTGTAFQMEVWDLLLEIPYGQTTTYGALAKRIAARRGLDRMSAQAIGSAVGRNDISIIVPCHRVVGSDGSLTGYAGGIEKKEYMLRLEGVDVSCLASQKIHR